MSRLDIEQPGLALRILRFPLTVMVLGFIGFLFVYLAAGTASGRGSPGHGTPIQPLIALACAAIAVWLYKQFTCYVEGRPDAEFSGPGGAAELGRGLATGFAVFAAMTGVVWLLGGITFDGVRGMGKLWSLLTMAILSGVMEEILFRGVLFRQLERLTGSWISLGLTAALFGLLHIGNPGATWFSSFAIALEAGLLLGGAFMLTQRLWFPVGIHAAWNFTQGWVFSVPVSGGKAPEGLLLTTRNGPDWLTGGAFGLEASAVAMVVATAAGAGMAWLAWKRGNVRPPAWKRAAPST